MSQELIAIIEQIERERGIKKEILIDAVKSALMSAARKVIDVKPEEELKIELDANTGKFKHPHSTFFRIKRQYSRRRTRIKECF